MSNFYRHAKGLLAAEKSFGTKAYFFLWLKILTSAAIIIYFIRKINLSDVVRILSTADIYLLSLAGLLSFLNLFFQFLKWRLISRECLGVDSPKKLTLSLMHGIAAASFTPARLGECVGRKLALPDTSLLQVTIATFVDKLFALFITICIGTAAAILYLHFIENVSVYLTLSLLIVFAVCLVFDAYLITHQSLWNSFLIRQLKEIRLLRGVAYKFSLLKNLDSKTLWYSMLLNFIFYSCYLLQYAILIRSFAPEANFIDTLWSGSLMFFAKTIIPAISIGDLGIREGASMYFSKQFGISELAGLNAALAIFIINIALPAFVGMLLLFKKTNA